MRYLTPLILIALAALTASAQDAWHNESGGPLSPEQAAYDVRFYDVKLRVNPDTKRIDGALTLTAKAKKALPQVVVDLDPALSVSQAEDVAGPDARPLTFERRGGQIWVTLARPAHRGQPVKLRLTYGGVPHEARNAPWDGGFVWKRTPDGQPWVGVACQGSGADLWFPCKDHPSDEPDDGMALHITVPTGLVCAASGKLESVVPNDDTTTTYNWRVHNPINNYAASINIAPYRTIEADYTSVTGEKLPVTYWVLPQTYAAAEKVFPQFLEDIRFLEDNFGPFPFRTDKIGLVETPYLGMEHQTIVAYGGTFKNASGGFIQILFHELAHEWWANLVTAADWKDFWLHEGFVMYSEALYAEKLQGMDGYHAYMNKMRHYLNNAKPIAPREPQTADGMYQLPPPRQDESDGDIYYKGMWVLHTLRWVIGEDAMRETLHRFAYPSRKWERRTDGTQTRLVSTDQFIKLAEKVSGKKLGWFFDVYARRAALPRLVSEQKPDSLELRWETPDDLPFPLPVEVKVGDRLERVPMKHGHATIKTAGQPVEIDPNHWLLRDEVK